MLNLNIVSPNRCQYTISILAMQVQSRVWSFYDNTVIVWLIIGVMAILGWFPSAKKMFHFHGKSNVEVIRIHLPITSTNRNKVSVLLKGI